jgi:Sulfotransferase family
VGGSGTRVFHAIIARCGRYMGLNVNFAGDALDFYEFASRWIVASARATAQGGSAPSDPAMADEFRACVAQHLRFAPPDAPWGWKQPRSLYFLPFLARSFDDLRFIHVVRDGRDVAFGPQAETVLNLAGVAMLEGSERDEPRPLQLMRLWARANALAADFGESELGHRYLRVRFEDLCESPAAVVKRLVEFDGALAPNRRRRRKLARLVDPPTGLGRWRDEDPNLVADLTLVAHDELRRFGYAAATAPGG